MLAFPVCSHSPPLTCRCGTIGLDAQDTTSPEEELLEVELELLLLELLLLELLDDAPGVGAAWSPPQPPSRTVVVPSNAGPRQRLATLQTVERTSIDIFIRLVLLCF